MCLQHKISQPKLGQIAHVGGVLKSSGPADLKTDSGFENSPRFVGVIEQNKIQQTFPHNCTKYYTIFRSSLKKSV